MQNTSKQVVWIEKLELHKLCDNNKNLDEVVLQKK